MGGRVALHSRREEEEGGEKIAEEESHKNASMDRQLQLQPKKLVEHLLVDLRNLSNEAKKKHPHVKEVVWLLGPGNFKVTVLIVFVLQGIFFQASESCVVKLRTLSTGAGGKEQLQERLRQASSELLHPLLLACTSRQQKLVQLSLIALQRLVAAGVVDYVSPSALLTMSSYIFSTFFVTS